MFTRSLIVFASLAVVSFASSEKKNAEGATKLTLEEIRLRPSLALADASNFAGTSSSASVGSGQSVGQGSHGGHGNSAGGNVHGTAVHGSHGNPVQETIVTSSGHGSHGVPVQYPIGSSGITSQDGSVPGVVQAAGYGTQGGHIHSVGQSSHGVHGHGIGHSSVGATGYPGLGVVGQGVGHIHPENSGIGAVHGGLGSSFVSSGYGSYGGVGLGAGVGHGIYGSFRGSCRYWCRTPRGQVYCCEGNNAPLVLPFVKPGQCPPVRPECPPVRNYSPPSTCNSDARCPGAEKCCFDTCLQHHTCKLPSFY